jgi:hypothetical protein
MSKPSMRVPHKVGDKFFIDFTCGLRTGTCIAYAIMIPYATGPGASAIRTFAGGNILVI